MARMKMRSNMGGGNYDAAERAQEMEGVATEDKKNIKAIVDTDDGDSDNEDFGNP